ncbi:MAG TPA: rhomboid family intramembrane serine protease [Solirubrobacteraceae bacterium]|nr:rhomboid family intramembrane serine protease [Solirubrobacteraceae bacterium]
MATCYRHPSRETRVACSNCGRPICPDCMTTTAVGMRCPECARDRTPVRTMRNITTGGLEATRALIAVNVVAFLASGSFSVSGNPAGDTVLVHGELAAWNLTLHHEYWRLVTAGFLHQNLVHIGFNMYLLYVLGQLLEPALGKRRFLAVYFVGLLAGACGSLVGVDGTSATIGASGAVFGLMGAAIVEMRARGIDPMQSGIPALIGINLLISVVFAGKISIGGHIGGLIGGVLAALVLGQADRHRARLLGVAGCLVLALASVGGAIAIADQKTAQLPPAVRQLLSNSS